MSTFYYRNGTGGTGQLTHTEMDLNFTKFNAGSTGHSLDINTLTCTGDITAYFSDERLKDIKGPIQDPLAKLRGLNGFYYEPNSIAVSLGYENKGPELGVSAQEVQAVLPEIVSEAPVSSEYLTIDYAKLTVLLIEAVKELSNKIEKLEEK